MTPNAIDHAGEARPARGWGSLWPWLFLISYIFLTSVGSVFHSAQGHGPSGPYELLARLGLVVLLWHWLTDQCRPYRAAFALDMGMFIALVGVILVPYYLWRYERWRGVAKVAVLIACYIAAYLFSAVCLAALFAFVGDRDL
jgi:hypothetical protein